jgi:hypothetical protein
VSNSGRPGRKLSHYSEDGLRIRKEKPHMSRVREKHIKNALRSPHLVDYLADADEDEDM